MPKLTRFSGWIHFEFAELYLGHQYTYRLVHAEGEYVPRKSRPAELAATEARRDAFFRERHLPTLARVVVASGRSTLTDLDSSGPDTPEGLYK